VSPRSRGQRGLKASWPRPGCGRGHDLGVMPGA